MSEKPGTPSSEHSEKAKKYDRQLRLWGDHGQANLEASHVCLLNATATGTETLKSLILPAVGAVTVVDDQRVVSQDLGNNFFIDKTSIGNFRGEVALNNLLALNPDVRGTFVEQSLDKILVDQPDFFHPYHVVIASNVIESNLLKLSKLLWEVNIPLVVVRSYGFIGYIRIQVKEHTIIESHPDNVIPDLRLDRPFPSLIEHVENINFEAMCDREHSHVPYSIILLYALKQWQAKYGHFPQNYQDKRSLKAVIKGLMRDKKSGEPEENFEEAIKAVNTCVLPTTIPAPVEEILKVAGNYSPSPGSKSFWLLAKALYDFVSNEGNGVLPVSGVIPDMTADSDKYVQLQNLYREQAANDADCVYKRINEICQQIGPRKSLILENDVRDFCKYCRFIKVIRGRSIAEEYESPIIVGDMVNWVEDPETDLVWYIMLRAVDQFYSEYRGYPGYFKEQVETDIVKLKVCVNRLLSEWGSNPCVKDDFIHEMCRYGGAEVHSVAGFIGGCAAQEVIKLLTGQYVPINNTLIYNAIVSNTAVFSL